MALLLFTKNPAASTTHADIIGCNTTGGACESAAYAGPVKPIRATTASSRHSKFKALFTINLL
jgi:hypothetical protein